MICRLFAGIMFLGSVLFSSGVANSKDIKLALVTPNALQQLAPDTICGDGVVAGISCRPRIRLAAGAECPANSGDYCSDELPYCCGTPGNYYCAKDVNGC